MSSKEVGTGWDDEVGEPPPLHVNPRKLRVEYVPGPQLQRGL